MIHEALCEAFCADVQVTPVPIGFAVHTPHLKPDGDFSGFYIRRHPERDEYRIEDDGCTVADLEAAGFDLDKETRFEAFADLLTQHSVFYDDAAVLLSTDYMPMEQLAQAAISFSYFMARVQDLTLLVGTRVQRSFKEDLADLIEQQFSTVAKIERNAPLDKQTHDYIVDFVVRSQDGRILAIFAGTGEIKALESLLFWERIKGGGYENVRPLMVLEGAKPAAIKERTLSRVMNSGLHLATLDGGTIDLAEKLRRTLTA